MSGEKATTVTMPKPRAFPHPDEIISYGLCNGLFIFIIDPLIQSVLSDNHPFGNDDDAFIRYRAAFASIRLQIVPD
jgi:hypothetical protein